MKKYLFSIVLMTSMLVVAQVPEFSNRLVNDYADVLSRTETENMEQRLRSYYDTTSNAILVIISNDLGGYEIADYAQRIGEKWGVGTHQYNNGLVIVLSPENHETFIATGYGLEGVLPDITCHRIAEDCMKPLFKEEEYYEGLMAGLDYILPIASKEYGYEQLVQAQKEKEKEELHEALFAFLIIISFLVILLFIGFKINQKKKYERKVLKAITHAKTRTEMEDAKIIALKKVSKKKVEQAVTMRRMTALQSIETVQTYRQLVESMSIARDFEISDEQITEAQKVGILSIIAAIGNARDVTQLQAAIKDAQIVGATTSQIENGKIEAIRGTVDAIGTATQLSQLQEFSHNAKSLGAEQSSIDHAQQLAGEHALQRIENPTNKQLVEEAIAIATAVGISLMAINKAKKIGQKRAVDLISKGASTSAIDEAAELALFLGASALLVKTTKMAAKMNITSTPSSSWGGSGRSFSSGSSGHFGGFGGGHFGGGGGGAKW